MTAHPASRDDADARPTPAALDVRHDAFAIERRFDVARSSVFAAFADEATHRRWFRLPGKRTAERHEFRVGGGVDATSTFHVAGTVPEQLAYHSHYLDIVPDRRLVLSYTSTVNEVPRWSSLVTVLFADADDDGCLLTWTEQVAFLARTGDGSDDFPHLRGGTALRLNGLAAVLQGG